MNMIFFLWTVSYLKQEELLREEAEEELEEAEEVIEVEVVLEVEEEDSVEVEEVIEVEEVDSVVVEVGIEVEEVALEEAEEEEEDSGEADDSLHSIKLFIYTAYNHTIGSKMFRLQLLSSFIFSSTNSCFFAFSRTPSV
jgi:hypothetical protein